MNAQTLIDAAYLRHRASEDPKTLHAQLPEVLRIVLELLLDDLDFEADPKSGTASAARMLACMVATLEPAPPYIEATRSLVRRTEDVQQQALSMLGLIAKTDPYAREILDDVGSGRVSVREALASLQKLWSWSR
jgi:hypothetical protein